ncbi:MAG: hypothetical protein A3B86_02340 [Candidatus Yanofskybacteria bacterium RIFCSPHIGHO2_02_FULL_38_22b]|uniref:Bacterial surface antigen (D15) domain-containing protein n=1 Tax=Candidatus Yanofskybacteria bacterium RIFCSPHIGHO2_02_FULL_38_22b TaxID=1802673 RepID=A0A1F8F3D9_9BACT|nr:MAG: hypothetical protein A3B86_02340 [Candidatus Yanofskybacteria bacterium RIFCSPHIGHO2_02_FULL_38_22b]OGN20286.1 MAG: hypothetical protein A2910_03175 [Candidatus Yanofskybacteria bacterium RIFCSPLOWO2_01_FULL_39_28]
MFRKSCLILLLSTFYFLLSASSVHAQFGKNNVRYGQLDKVYPSFRFDIRHNLDTEDPRQMEYLRQVVDNLERARDWMGGPAVFNHNIEKRIPVFFYKTHTDMESSNLVGGFLPEGVGAFVESERRRMVLKADFSKPLGRAIGVHELVHEFQFDIYNPNLLQRNVIPRLPNGWYEGCAEFIAGLYDPHTRDDIRRREQRMYASNPRLLPTWLGLNAGSANPYTMWSMIPEFLEEKFSFGTEFCVEPLKNDVRLGEFVYDKVKGELGNPDVNSERFDQQHRHYWGTEKGYEVARINSSKPYDENDYFKGRTVTPYGHPYPMFSPILSADGREIAAFSIQDNGVALIRYLISQEGGYLSKEDREKIKDKNLLSQFSNSSLIKNLTPQLPPVPWEYIVVQGLETWPFNGFDAAWSHDGKKIAFFARINRDHALVIIDAETGKIIRKIEFEDPEFRLDQAFSPSFNADDCWIYFSAAKNIQRDIYAVSICDPHIGRMIQVTDDERFDTAPSVSSDGSKIVYVGSDDDFQHLFLYDVRRGEIEQLTFGSFNDSSPSWSDDGTTIVYTSEENGLVWKINTLDLATLTVKQWPELMGGAYTPMFARRTMDTVYYVTFRDDDQFQDQIYFNFEVFEAKLKKPVRQYTVAKKEAGSFVFNPNRDLFRINLDSNQLLNPKKPPEDWACGGGNIQVGVNTYYGMFGQSYFGCSNILETKHHRGLVALYGNFRLIDYSYVNQEKRTTWVWGIHQYQLPLYYQFYDAVHRYPRQNILNNTWMKELSLDLFTQYPLDKFNRWELFSKLGHRSYNVFGYDTADLDAGILDEADDVFTDQDVQLFKFMKNSNGSNLSFGAAYVRDTVLFSGNTWGPFHGNAFRAQVEFAPPLGEEFQGFTSVNVSARTYRHLGSSSLLAGRVEVMTSTRANGDFILLCGPDRLRGCEYGSIVGNQIGYVSGELRFPVPWTYVLGTPVRGFLFGDAAYTGFNDERFSVRKIKTYGFGFQYFIPLIGLPAQSVWNRENGKWNPTFYITLHW